MIASLTQSLLVKVPTLCALLCTGTPGHGKALEIAKASGRYTAIKDVQTPGDQIPKYRDCKASVDG